MFTYFVSDSLLSPYAMILSKSPLAIDLKHIYDRYVVYVWMNVKINYKYRDLNQINVHSKNIISEKIEIKIKEQIVGF